MSLVLVDTVPQSFKNIIGPSTYLTLGPPELSTKVVGAAKTEDEEIEQERSEAEPVERV